MTNDEIRATALRLAATPNGCRTSDPVFAGHRAALVGGVIGKLVLKGQLFTAFVSHKKRVWFDTAERAKAFQASTVSSAPTFPAQQSSRLAWDRAEPVITSETKVFIAETPKPRFQAIEFGAIVPALQRGRVSA